MSASSLGTAILRQRQSIGLDLPTLASIAGVPAARWREIESGAAPSVWELDAIAAAVAIDPSILRSGELDGDPRRSSARFRAPSGIDALGPRDVRALARVAEAARIHAFLRAKLPHPPGQVSALRQVEAVKAGAMPGKQGYALGRRARERMSPARQPIPSLQHLLEEWGVLVVSLRLDTPSIDGASLFETGASPAILINTASDRANHALSRRAILAHELCHLLHDSSKDRDLLTVVSREHDHGEVEQRANGFAPAFLAPDGWVKIGAKADDRSKVLAVAKWGLSFDGAAWHAKNLRMISHDVAESLPRENVASDAFEAELARVSPSRIGLEIEPSPMAQSALGDLAIRAAESDLISRGRAAEILALT